MHLRLPTILLPILAFRTHALPTIADVITCLDTAGVPQEIPGSAEFTQDIVPYNLRVPFTPQALAIPTTIPQIQDAVACAFKHNVKVNPRSGGHSYASHSLGGEDGHLVIDLKYLNSVSLDTETGLATVGPGARLGNMALELYKQGKRGIAHGICPGLVNPFPKSPEHIDS
jgi:hypothetical protein